MRRSNFFITLTPAFRFPDLKGDKKNYLKQFGGMTFRQPVRLRCNERYVYDNKAINFIKHSDLFPGTGVAICLPMKPN
jgi:hypothetical protein